ncbi:MAG TPA: trigger factor, partial [Verrucomicrobiae bacterium]|nr:trigger factor [Verrucomicrobiae bacterium]
KAPRDMVLRKYEKDIEDEVKKKLISDSYREAMKEQKLAVLGYPDIEEIQFGRGQALQFAATIETAPEFELPEYKGIPAKREIRSVTDADMERALDALRQQQLDYKTVERPAQAGDIVVVNYTGTSDGKPITDIAPNAKGLTEQKNFWVEMQPDSFIPGFADQLTGAKAGDKRTVNVDFPADFVTPELQGKKGVYDVEIVEVKEKVLPAVDEAFAKSFGAESVEKLREGVRKDLENELEYSQTKNVRGQLIRSLLDRVNFDLPETTVAEQTRHVVYDIVRENQKRGISRAMIEQQKDQIYAAAASGAKERVKVAFILDKIAQKENIKATEEELSRRVVQLAAMYQIPTDQFVKDLQKRNGFSEIYETLRNEKVMDFLQQNAKIEEVPAGNPAPQQA